MHDDIHIPVMLERTAQLLEPALAADGAVLVDGTLGMGGHAAAMLRRLPGLRLIGIDRDEDAIAIASRRLAFAGDRVTIVHAVYDDLPAALAAGGVAQADGVLLDLGVSSLQLDRAERGFAYARSAPLDMRMDRTAAVTAADVIAQYSQERLASIFQRYGEERLAKRYAAAIVKRRALHPIRTSDELVGVIVEATPAAVARSGHPAKRVFQALRIEVNQELETLERAIPQAVDALGVGGRIVVLAYHSLEDRIVKRALAAKSTSSAPAGLPVELPEHRPELRLLTRGAELADAAEREANPRSASVRLRAAERLRKAA